MILDDELLLDLGDGLPLDVLEPEEVGTVSTAPTIDPLGEEESGEDIEFLNSIDKGYIGISRPKIKRIIINDLPYWHPESGADYRAEDSGMTIGDIKER